MTYKCYKIKAHKVQQLPFRINAWLSQHENVQMINMSVVHDEEEDTYYAFITYSEKEN